MPTSASVSEVGSTVICEGTVVKQNKVRRTTWKKGEAESSMHLSSGERKCSSQQQALCCRRWWERESWVERRGSIRPLRPLRRLHCNYCCRSIVGRRIDPANNGLNERLTAVFQVLMKSTRAQQSPLVAVGYICEREKSQMHVRFVTTFFPCPFDSFSQRLLSGCKDGHVHPHLLHSEDKNACGKSH